MKLFEQVKGRFSSLISHWSSAKELNEKNIEDSLQKVREALLEADVGYDVVEPFLQELKQKSLGLKAEAGLSPGQVFIQMVHRGLVDLMGTDHAPLQLNCPRPAVILMAGLQGSGKTTTTAKLAKHLKEELKQKRILITSCDIYRPGALQQLQVLANGLNMDFLMPEPNQKPTEIAHNALQKAQKELYDVLLVDTAGRLHVDEHLMDEIKQLHQILKPIETLFVVDSMTGQDAVHSAKAFSEALPLTGVILTKVDGDARGGAALSIRYLTGKPIKFMGVGEKNHQLEPFHPERIASRILDMGDILTLIEQTQKNFNTTQTQKMEQNLKKGQFDFEDFLLQLKQIQKMGGMMNILDKLPGMGSMMGQVKQALPQMEGMLKSSEAIISSMTLKERRFPALLINSPSRASRQKRIAKGAGVSVQKISEFLKQFEKMQKMAKTMANPMAMKRMMDQVKGQPWGR